MAEEYWDKILNKKALNSCESRANPKECREIVKNSEKLWIQYRDAMAETLDIISPRLIVNFFVAEETKKQAQLLDVDDDA
ncbi:MAG: hypothetical protein IJU79_05000 [Desulfovibrionaceae bacterium]|nr:hypothetical protein [Desulfovibrionaceae bacterium]